MGDIRIKTEEQIAGIRRSGRAAHDILDEIAALIRPGVSTNELNDWAHDTMLSRGLLPAPLNYNGFPKSICTSVNQVICHGIPGDDPLREGDILNVDVTCVLDGFYGDTSRMFTVGQVSPEAMQLVNVTRQCLEAGIAQVHPGARFGEIGHAIQCLAESHGYSVVRNFAGHGVGVEFHEAPFVQHYGEPGDGPRMAPGMVFTIEPMINQGVAEHETLPDGWTAVTRDGLLSAQWEHTVCVTVDGVEVLTA